MSLYDIDSLSNRLPLSTADLKAEINLSNLSGLMAISLHLFKYRGSHAAALE